MVAAIRTLSEFYIYGKGTTSMHDTNINVRSSEDVLSSIGDVGAEFVAERRSIDEWRLNYCESLFEALSRPDIDIFNGFINSLLEQAMSGKACLSRCLGLGILSIFCGGMGKNKILVTCLSCGHQLKAGKA